MNPLLDLLQPYPFERLAELKKGVTPPPHKSALVLSIGEPQHPTPHLVTEALLSHLHGLRSYPTTKGLDALRETIAAWLSRRFGIPEQLIDPATHVLPVNGTREALFAFAQAVLDPTADAIVVMPNPFYQIYEGAALLAGAEPYFVVGRRDYGYAGNYDDVPEEIWRRCKLLYICTPGNPHGAVVSVDELKALLELAEKYDFIVASDECYSELYREGAAPPPSLLSAAHAMGNHDYKRCVVFHSLSKRSNAPGLRSGFVAGDSEVLSRFHLYRTYHGCAMSLPVQHASMAAWRDEAHVQANRAAYTAKFESVLNALGDTLNATAPDAGFYLWLETPTDDAEFARRFYAEENVTVLPGSYLSRESRGENPGARHIRVALVAELTDCVDAATRLKSFVHRL